MYDSKLSSEEVSKMVNHIGQREIRQRRKVIVDFQAKLRKRVPRASEGKESGAAANTKKKRTGTLEIR